MRITSGIRTAAAINAVAASTVCALFIVYITIRHWHTIGAYAFVILLLPVCVQIYAQFRRAIKAVDSLRMIGTVPIGDIAGSIFDLVFWASITNTALLALIAMLLGRIDGFI